MMVATGVDTPLGKSLYDPEGSIAFQIEFGGLMGKFQVFPFEPDLVPNVVLAWDGSVSFYRFVDGPGGLIFVFHHFLDTFFCHLII
jgi:hypothetical protein